MANNTSRRGFASMNPDKQREIASKGGKAAHEKGTAHQFDSRSAAEAGRKGGKASHQNRTTSSNSSDISSMNSDYNRNDQGEFESGYQDYQ